MTSDSIEHLLRAITASIPDTVANSTVVIAAGNDPFVRHFGSGTLFAVADRRFVVTAAHVLQQAMDYDSTVGIGGGSEGYFVAAIGNWIVPRDDRFDIAIYLLDQSQCERLGTCTFLRIADVSFDSDLSRGFFVVSGFPSIWSTVSTAEHESMQLRLLQYSTCAYGGDSTGLGDYDSRYHLLLDARPEHLFDASGATMRLRMPTGHPARMPGDLSGISGCGVWMIGDLRVSCQSWRADQARLVGVETGVFHDRAAIKATRWNAVTTLLYSAFTDLGPTLKLYTGN
jgi:hypothetical protein